MPTSQSGKDIWAIVPAAGSGIRMRADRPKQYLEVLGKPVLAHTLMRLAAVPGLRGIIVVLQMDDAHWTWLDKPAHVPLHVVLGGSERMHSVYNALRWLTENAAQAWVLVHDAARPCVRLADIEHLMTDVGDDEAGGLLALPLSDSLKRGQDARVFASLPRENLWRAQTPQYFPALVLQQAMQQAIQQSLLLTDEAQAMELAGYRPHLVCGHADNIKVTHAEDLARVALYLQQQLSEESK